MSEAVKRASGLYSEPLIEDVCCSTLENVRGDCESLANMQTCQWWIMVRFYLERHF